MYTGEVAIKSSYLAVLAGDALLTLAFETVLSEKAAALNGFAKCAEAGRVLASCAGAEGMIGGQIIDIESENEARSISLERLRVMDEKKTGALIKAACLMGCISAGADEAAPAKVQSFRSASCSKSVPSPRLT